MRKILAFAFCFRAFFLCASAESPVWKISGGGRFLYLAGSVHMLREQDYPIPEAFDHAFAGSDALVLEADIFSEKTVSEKAVYSALMRIVLGKSNSEVQNAKKEFWHLLLGIREENVLPAGETLQTRLTEETFLVFKEKIDILDVQIPLRRDFIIRLTIDDLLEVDPYYLVNIVIPVISALKINALQPGADMLYYFRSSEENKAVYFLETVQFQKELMRNLGREEGEPYLLDHLDFESVEELEKVFSEMVLAWRDGNLFDEKLLDASLDEMLVKNRNLSWLPKIEEYIESEPVELIIVGIGHLGGDDGLLTLLKNSGYMIEQLQ